MGEGLRHSLWRLAKAVAVVAAVVAGLVWVSKRRAREAPVVQPALWPPVPLEDLAPPGTETATVPLAPDPVGADEPGDLGDTIGDHEAADVVWVLPKEGACPDGYPVKAKVASHIYHLPGGTSYTRTVPDRCYASPADAEADGFRPAKR